MYSYEDRIRIVELYIELGKRVRRAIRQLGYPTKNSLKSWYNEYQRKLDLPTGYAGRRPKSSQEQKAAALENYLTHDRCIAATVRIPNYPGRGTLNAWVREALPEARRTQAGVMELCAPEESAQAVADKFGVRRPTLYNWENQLLGREAPASMKNTNQSPPSQERDELQRQVESLRREVRQLRLAQDLLNKANELLKKSWASTCSSCPIGRRHC